MDVLYANLRYHNDGVKLRADIVGVCSTFCTGFINDELGQIWMYYTRIRYHKVGVKRGQQSAPGIIRARQLNVCLSLLYSLCEIIDQFQAGLFVVKLDGRGK